MDFYFVELTLIINISADITPSQIKPFLKKETGSIPSLLLRTLPIPFLHNLFYSQHHALSGYIPVGLGHPQFFSEDGGHGK